MPTLRSREDFARIGAKGRTRADRLMVVRFVPNTLDHDRFGIATGRRVGSAVARNRVRRRIKEILRHEPVRPGERTWDILIVVRPASAAASFRELSDALGRLLGAIRDGGSVRARP